ncbi:MAG: hypothetical protein IJ781_13400, partial [Atopobiaceae bacterium]|nr:hypothetical protein [Atopobiaceae bacterium]
MDDKTNERVAVSSSTELHYGHPRMSLADRAKIFIPFDPLKGFREALEEQERQALEKHEHTR